MQAEMLYATQLVAMRTFFTCMGWSHVTRLKTKINKAMHKGKNIFKQSSATFLY